MLSDTSSWSDTTLTVSLYSDAAISDGGITFNTTVELSPGSILEMVAGVAVTVHPSGTVALIRIFVRATPFPLFVILTGIST